MKTKSYKQILFQNIDILLINFSEHSDFAMDEGWIGKRLLKGDNIITNVIS